MDTRGASVLRAFRSSARHRLFGRAVAAVLIGAATLAQGSSDDPWGDGQGGASVGFDDPGEPSAESTGRNKTGPKETGPSEAERQDAAASALEKSAVEIDAANKEVVLEDVTEETCEELTKRARRLGHRPLVEILSVRPGAVGIRVSVTSARVDAKNALSLCLLEFMKAIPRGASKPAPHP